MRSGCPGGNGFGRDSAEGQGSVDPEGLFVRRQLHFFDSLGPGDFFVFDAVEGPRVEGFVFYVEAGEFFAGGCEGVEVRGEGDAGEFAFQVGGVAFAVFGVMEQGVDVVED